MKLRELKIHNFRSIRDATLNIVGYTLVVGANNCGKSTVIDCIRAVYEKDKFKFSTGRDFPHGEVTDQESWAELEFELDSAEYADLAAKYQLSENRLRLRKIFKTEGQLTDGMLYGFLDNGSLDTEPFYGAKGVQNGKIGEVIYVPAVSSVDEHTKLSGPSALRDLLTDLISDVASGSAAYQQFDTAFVSFIKDVKAQKNSSDQSVSDFEEELDKSLESWQAGFRVNFRPPAAQDLIKSLMSWELSDDATGKDLNASSFGSGFQRHFIFSLIRVGAKYAKTLPNRKSKDFTPNLRLLLFEEPEAFLHPPQQVALSNDLRALSDAATWQVISSTHSSHFVSRRAEELTSIIRLNREGTSSSAHQLTQGNWQDLLDARKDLEVIIGESANLSDDEKAQLETIRYFLWINPERSGLFFAKKVLIVEGLSELGLMSKLCDSRQISGMDHDCFVLSCDGKYNIHRFMRLLTMMGIPHAVMFDEDFGKSHHQKLNELISVTADAGFTLGLVPIKGDLETYLGMPKPADRIKPQLMIQRYESGTYDHAKMQELCERLAAVLRR